MKKKEEVDIKSMEKRILTSTKNLNEILELMSLVEEEGRNVERTTETATSLTRIFIKLRKHGKMTIAKGMPSDSPQGQIVTWLNERYTGFVTSLLKLFGAKKVTLQVESMIALAYMQLIALTLCLRLVKDETAHNGGETMKFSNRTYTQLVDALLQSEGDESLQQEFIDKYLNQYYDLQFFFLQNAAYIPVIQD